MWVVDINGNESSGSIVTVDAPPLTIVLNVEDFVSHPSKPTRTISKSNFEH